MFQKLKVAISLPYALRYAVINIQIPGNSSIC